jgi:predicted RecB family endonuclease
MTRSMKFAAFALFGFMTFAVGQNMPAAVVLSQNGLNARVRDLQRVIPELLKNCEKKCDDLRHEALTVLDLVTKAADTLEKETDKQYAALVKVCKK